MAVEPDTRSWLWPTASATSDEPCCTETTTSLSSTPRRVGDRGEHVDGRVGLGPHESDDGSRRELRGRIRGQERHAGRAGRLAAARRDRHGDAIGAGVRRGEVELRRAADDGRCRGSIIEDPRRGEGELAGRAGDVRRDVDREARSRGVGDRERLQVRLRIAEHAPGSWS